MASRRPYLTAPGEVDGTTELLDSGFNGLSSALPHCALGGRTVKWATAKGFQWPLVGPTSLRRCPAGSRSGSPDRHRFQWPLVGPTSLRPGEDKDAWRSYLYKFQWPLVGPTSLRRV